MALFLLLTSCDAAGRIAPAERALEARRDALVAYLAATGASAGASGRAPIVPFRDVLFVVRQPLIEELISATLPLERDVIGRYRIRVERAEVTLQAGLALVELSGRASSLERGSVFADITLLGGLTIDATRVRAADPVPTLSGHVEIFGLDMRDIGVGGLSPPAERLVEGLARVRVSELNRVLRDVPVPIRLQERIELPAVEEPEVTIPAVAIDATFELDGVRVLEEGLFVSLHMDRSATELAPRP